MVLYRHTEREVMKLMEKTIAFDMDGTLYDFYGVPNWLESLQAESPEPYDLARPMVNMKEFNKLGKILTGKGYKIIIVSWLAKDSGKEYDRLVRRSKKQALERDIDFELEKIHLIKYGANKRYRTKAKYLFDDNEQNIKEWIGKKKDRIGFLCDKYDHEYNNKLIIGTLNQLARG